MALRAGGTGEALLLAMKKKSRHSNNADGGSKKRGQVRTSEDHKQTKKKKKTGEGRGGRSAGGAEKAEKGGGGGGGGHRGGGGEGSWGGGCLCCFCRACSSFHISASLRISCGRFLDNQWVELSLTFFTIFALFAEDIRMLWTSVEADPFFDALTIFFLILFTAEICMSCVARRDYLLHLFFYLDVISLLSLILDLSWVDAAMHTWAEGGGGVSDGGGDASELSGMSKAGKAGSKVARMLRLIRLVRLIRVAKLYKNLSFTGNTKKNNRRYTAGGGGGVGGGDGGKGDGGEDGSFLEPGNSMDSDLKEEDGGRRGSDGELLEGKNDGSVEDEFESEVSKQLTELTTRKIVFVVLSLTLVLPLLSTEHYLTRFASERSTLEVLAEYATGT